MKSFYAVLTCLVTFLLAVNAQTSPPFDYKTFQKLAQPISAIAAMNGSTAAEFAKKTPAQIVHHIAPQMSVQAVAAMSQKKISTALLTMLDTKSLADILKSYKGFSAMPGADTFKSGIMQYIVMCIQFDQPSQTAVVVSSLGNLTGGASIGQALGTTDAALIQRHYLSDAYPLLKNNIRMIMNKTSGQFIQGMTKLPEKYYKAFFPPGAVDKILAARADMAEAMVSGSYQAIMAATTKLQAATATAMAAITQKLSKAVTIEGMTLIDATKKCNITKSAIGSKTVMQISLLCLGLPEDFPLMKMMPQQGFPRAAFETKLTDIAKKVKMPVESLLKLTANQVVLKFMQAKQNDPSVSDPIFYVAKNKSLSITNMGGKTLLEVGSTITAKSAAYGQKLQNATATLVGHMKNNTLDALPVLVKNLLGVTFSKKYFYFLSLSSIMKSLDERISKENRKKAISNFIIPLNKVSKSEVAKILGKTEKSLDETSIMKLLGMMTGKNDQAVASWLKLGGGQAILQKINLKTAEQLLGTFGIGGDLVLNHGSVLQMAKNPAFPILFMSIGRIAVVTKDPKFFVHTLMTLHLKHGAMIGPIAKKIGVTDSVLQALTMNDVRSAMKLSSEAFSNETLYTVLFKLAKMSKEKISPDFGVMISQLSAKKGIPLASLAGITFYETMKKVTDATWQLPILIHKKKGNLTLVKVLMDGKNETETMLRVIVRPRRSYNYTIDRLLDVLVGLDTPDTTTFKLTTLANFLTNSMGMKPPSSPTVIVTGLAGKPFVTYVMPKLVLRINDMFRRKSFVHAYAREEFGVTPAVFDLLYKQSDGDIGKKLATATIGVVTGDHDTTLNTLFELTAIKMNFAKRFVNIPLKEVMKACEGLSVLSVKETLREILNKCMKEGINQLERTDKRLINSPIYDVPLEEIKDILGLKNDYLDKNITAISMLMADGKLRPLFIPFKDAMKNLNMTMEEGKKMSLKKILNLPNFPKHFLLNFSQRKFNSPGVGSFAFLQFSGVLGGRSVEDLRKLTRKGSEDLSKATLYGILKGSVSIMKNSPCKSGLAKCNKHEDCTRGDKGDGFICSCKSGYKNKGAGCVKEGVTEDQCKKTKCPDDSICVTLASRGPVCKCRSRWHKMKKGKCQRLRGHAIEVKKMRLKQKYQKEYGDKNSMIFKSKASEIENILDLTLCQKLGCTAIVVTAINKGSLLVDFEAVFDPNTNVSATQVVAATTAAMKSPKMATLSPDTASKPQAQESNPCESGMADCGKHTNCVSASRGSYTCSCEKGYKKKGADCVKGGVSMVVIIIIIIVAFVIVVVIIGVVIYKMRQRRQGHSDQYGMAFDNKKESERVQLTGEDGGGAGGYGFSYGGGRDSETKGRLDSEEVA